MSTYKLYVKQNINHWLRMCDENYNNIASPSFQTIENGYIVPLKSVENNTVADEPYLGGVCNSDRKFISGHLRKYYNPKMNYSCYAGYEFDKATYVSETVIYGGLLIAPFGHCMTESLNRLWYVLQEASDYRIAFVAKEEVPKYFWTFVELLGIAKERIFFVQQPMRFEKIIVPDQSLVMFGGYHEKYALMYDVMIENATRKEKGVGKKIYLSRTAFTKQDCINEEYFEEFYKCRGYAVVHMEKEPLARQIAIIHEAEDIVATVGTLTHFVLFAKANTKLTMLVRENEPGAIKPQIIFNQLRKINYTVVDVAYGFLPATHANSVFLIGPTESFLQYAEDEGFTVSEEEKQMDWKESLYLYIKKWLDVYGKKDYSYKRICSWDIFDVVNRMSTIFNGAPLSRKELPTQPKDNNIYVPRDIRLVSDLVESKNLQCLRIHIQKENENSVMLCELKRTIAEIENSDIVLFESAEYGFSFDDKMLRKLYNSTIDAVFMECSRRPGSLEERYLAEHSGESWNSMLEALKELYPTYYGEARWIFANNELYPRNTFVMKKETFQEMATWLIPLLEMISSKLSSEEQFLLDELTEMLITLYFKAGIKEYVCAFVQ